MFFRQNFYKKHYPGGRNHDQESHAGIKCSFPEEGFFSLEEIEKFVKTKLKTDCDFTGLDREIANKIARQYELLVKTYPDVAKKISYIGKGTGSPFPDAEKIFQETNTATACFAQKNLYSENGIHAGVSTGILFNEKEFFHDPLKMKDVEELSENSGWHPVGGSSPEGIMTHEFGHAVWFHAMDSGEYIPGQTGYIGNNGFGTMRGTLEDWAYDHQNLGDEVSRYAASNSNKSINRSEAFAEGFASLHFTPVEKQAQYVKDQTNLLHILYAPKRKTKWEKDPVLRAQQQKESLLKLMDDIGMSKNYENRPKQKQQSFSKDSVLQRLQQAIEEDRKHPWTEPEGYPVDPDFYKKYPQYAFKRRTKSACKTVTNGSRSSY